MIAVASFRVRVVVLMVKMVVEMVVGKMVVEMMVLLGHCGVRSCHPE